MLHALGTFLVCVCTAWTLLGALSVLIVTRSKKRATARTSPPITVLKPLCGADPMLEANLETFFAQDYPSYEIVFGVESASDPAARVAAQMVARHPERAARVVVHGFRRGTNPKIRNLRGMMADAAHDLVVVSDSNVRVPPEYLSDLVAEYQRGDSPAGLVTNLVRAVDASGLGGVLEGLQLAGFCAAGVAGPSLVGEALVIGKSMLFSRRTLDELGGLESLSNVLAEDYVMGKMFQHAGYPVRVARTVVSNVVAGATVPSFFERQLRWSMLRSRLRPLAYALEPVTSPLALLPVAWAVLGVWAFAWAPALLLLRDVGQSAALGGEVSARMLVASPLREIIGLLGWIHAPFRRHIAWRGHRVRLSSGSLAYVASRRTRGA